MKRKRYLIMNLIAWLIGLVWLVPFIGVLMTAIRPLDDMVGGTLKASTSHSEIFQLLGITRPLL